jgi:hypothetical protein
VFKDAKNKSSKVKKPISTKVKLIAKKPRKVKAALKSWVEASDKVNSDSLNLNGAPPWVENAYAEVVKVLMPSNRLPTSGDVDLELYGELLGRLQAFGKVFSGEIPMGLEAQAELDRLQTLAASQPQSPERKAREKAAVNDLNVRVKAVEQGISDLMKAAMSSSHEDTLKFQKGLSRGLNLSPDDLVSANVFERHTRTYYVLVTYWRFWVKCKSLREVYDHLCKAVGENKIGSFKTFERLCKKIRFKIRGRGRPPGKK